MAIYVAIIMPYILKIKEDVETYSPKVIYIGTFCGFFSLVT